MAQWGDSAPLPSIRAREGSACDDRCPTSNHFLLELLHHLQKLFEDKRWRWSDEVPFDTALLSIVGYSWDCLWELCRNPEPDLGTRKTVFVLVSMQQWHHLYLSRGTAHSSEMDASTLCVAVKSNWHIPTLYLHNPCMLILPWLHSLT